MFYPNGMHKRSNIDELINFNYNTRQLILRDQKIMAFIADNPSLDLDGADSEEFAERVKDHDFIDETFLKADAYVIIESEMLNMDTDTMKTMALYVTVICSKGFMDINPKKFPGVKGNRRDNIARLVNNLLFDNECFGIGGLELVSATIGRVPTGYTSRVLTYKVPSFAK